MSGELTPEVVLADAGDGAVLRLVRAAGTLFAQPDFAPAALVGGLAVTLRLAAAHRATNDVDTVADGDRPREVALDYVGDAGPGARIEIDGVKVDVMATDPLPDRVDDLPDDELSRLFVLGHRWALESAEPVAVRVLPSGGSAQPPPLTVATSPALVACKFHAIADRRDARSEKRESDAVDLVRLIDELVRPGGSAEPFLDAPFDLAELVAAQAQRWFLDDATRTARLLRLASVPGDAIMEPDEIAALGEVFVAMVQG
ncbi:MAG TPA: nucleotidyl transferase AbiEii/AbiGii toxin family protein [Acidimicrobiia bacterium]|nr:nucleotidyl transferase AbiEii/AbiGii toxin family protein [Acidimicrobiia bacterium]